MDTLIDWGSLLIQGINFAVVAFVLRKFFFVPYIKFLDEEAEKRKDLEEKLSKSTRILDDAHAQADNIIDQAKVDARMIASEITDNARKESSEILARAHSDADIARSKWFADIEQERKAILAELRTRVIDVALKMNEKLFGKNDTNAQFLKNAENTIEL
jgi:F-type H+-transporting ATPase subunit b